MYICSSQNFTCYKFIMVSWKKTDLKYYPDKIQVLQILQIQNIFKFKIYNIMHKHSLNFDFILCKKMSLIPLIFYF